MCGLLSCAPSTTVANGVEAVAEGHLTSCRHPQFHVLVDVDAVVVEGGEYPARDGVVAMKNLRDQTIGQRQDPGGTAAHRSVNVKV